MNVNPPITTAAWKAAPPVNCPCKNKTKFKAAIVKAPQKKVYACKDE